MSKKWLSPLYDIIPGKKLLFSAWKFLGSPPEKIFRHLHFPGAFRVKVDETHSFKIENNDLQLENEIFWRGLYYRYEKTSLRLWMQLCQNASVIIDVGANTGLYSLVAKAMNSAASVHAFEPVERVFNKLERNVKLNNYDVATIKKALSNTNGTSFIFDSLADHEYAASLLKNVYGSNVRKELIETVTLMDYMNENNVRHVDLMKIDVEGFEPEVLMGMGDYLRKMKPTLLIEIVEEENSKRIESIIAGIDYLFYEVDETDGCRLKSHIYKTPNNNWLLCSKETARQLNLPV
ncbi:MAG TPA: FkbM family methyltransferase [Chitinophagales bacterium]|nr:FkbM family methyltransferase [Chitinophagales bacterium]